MYRIGSKLLEVELKRLRPTQMTVGFEEVDKKRKSWSAMKSKEQRQAMREELFPVVKGPADSFYILDHHHTAAALIKEKTHCVQVGIVKHLSALDPDSFWIFLDHYSWVHPYDATGVRCDLKDIPDSFENLRDDPYRSLAGEVRDAGGFSKSGAPFLEFLWANYFREAVDSKLLAGYKKKAVKLALKLAKSDKSAHLPGWAGPS